MNKGKFDFKLNKVASWVNYQIGWRRTYRSLSALDDKTLDDLGITRYQIRDVARKAHL